MKTRIIKSAGVLLLALVMTLAMNAQPHRQGQRGMTQLDLTEAQSEEITQLRTDHYTSMKPLKAEMAEFKARERTLLSEKSVDLKSVDKLIDQQTDLMNKMKKLQTKHQVAMKNVLSDEQLMKLEQKRRHSAHVGQGRKGRRTGYGTGHGKGYDRGYGRDNGRSGRSGRSI